MHTSHWINVVNYYNRNIHHTLCHKCMLMFYHLQHNVVFSSLFWCERFLVIWANQGKIWIIKTIMTQYMETWKTHWPVFKCIEWLKTEITLRHQNNVTLDWLHHRRAARQKWSGRARGNCTTEWMPSKNKINEPIYMEVQNEPKTFYRLPGLTHMQLRWKFRMD